MSLQHPHNSLQRVLFLLKREWTLQRRSLLTSALTMVLVIGGIRLVPLLFSFNYNEWVEDLKYEPIFIVNFALSLFGFFIGYLIWVNKTIHKPTVQPYTLTHASVGEKYGVLFLVAIFYFIIALLIGFVISLLFVLFVPNGIQGQIENINNFTLIFVDRESANEAIGTGFFFFFSYIILSFLFYFIGQIFFHKALTGILIATFLCGFPLALPFVVDDMNVDVALIISSSINTLLSLFLVFFGYYILKHKQLK